MQSVNNSIIETHETIIDVIGEKSPYILSLITVIHLFRQPKYAIAYVVFVYISDQICIMLKRWIRQPRPVQILTDKTDPAYYGMPSGHAQFFLFTIVFILLVKPSWIVICICLTIGTIGLIERYKNKQHTILQLVAGGTLGVVLSMVSVFIFRKLLEVYI